MCGFVIANKSIYTEEAGLQLRTHERRVAMRGPDDFEKIHSEADGLYFAHFLLAIRGSPFVSRGCYLVVADGITEMLPAHVDNPAIAARNFAASNPNFVEQHLSTDKHPFVTYCQDGYLKRVK